jgi:hypothetical protein
MKTNRRQTATQRRLYSRWQRIGRWGWRRAGIDLWDDDRCTYPILDKMLAYKERLVKPGGLFCA